MALSEVNCLIGQTVCGREPGNPVCPKCGMDERVVYPGQADLEAVLEAARALYVAAQEAVEPPPPPDPSKPPTSPEPPPQPPKQPDPEPPATERKGINRLGLGVLVVALLGGGWWWKDQQDQRVRLAQEQAAQQAQAAEQARSDREAALQRAKEAESKRVAVEKAQAQNAERVAEAARLAAAERAPQLARKKLANETTAKQPTNDEASPQRQPLEPEMVLIAAGSFTMGSPASEPDRGGDEDPQYTVRVAAFELGKTEVTFAQWDACVADGGCSHRPSDGGRGRGNRPVVDVSWNDITGQYIPWINRKTSKNYRLPSEAEWEYAARAGCASAFNLGGQCANKVEPGEANFDSRYTYSGSSKGTWRAETLPVGSFSANNWGVYDMHGNVREWVQDCLGKCDLRGVRGGSSHDSPQDLRSARRLYAPTTFRLGGTGFRLARTVS